MKKILSALLMVGLALVLASCGNSKPKLYVYNWTYYIPQEVISDFEKSCNCQVVYDVFASNEEMYAKLKAGSSGYDVVFPSGDFVAIMMKENMLEKLDLSKIPNLKDIDPAVLKKETYDLGNQYSVPYMYAAAGIAVNTTYVKDYPRNYHIFERKDLKGKMTMLDDMREVIGAGLKTSGYSANSLDPKQLQQAKELILKWKPNLVKFDSESFSKGFAAGEFWVVQGYAENIFLDMDPKLAANVDFFLPDTGGTAYIDNMVILKTAKNKELAYQFINFIYEPTEYAKISDYLGIGNISIPARQLNKRKLHYTTADLAKTELKADLGPHLPVYTKLWESIRVQN